MSAAETTADTKTAETKVETASAATRKRKTDPTATSATTSKACRTKNTAAAVPAAASIPAFDKLVQWLSTNSPADPKIMEVGKTAEDMFTNPNQRVSETDAVEIFAFTKVYQIHSLCTNAVDLFRQKQAVNPQLQRHFARDHAPRTDLKPQQIAQYVKLGELVVDCPMLKYASLSRGSLTPSVLLKYAGRLLNDDGAWKKRWRRTAADAGSAAAADTASTAS